MKYQSKHWRDWINERFGDKNKFHIKIEYDKTKYTIRSSNPKIKTQIIFHFMRPDDDETLFDIHFSGSGSPKNNLWMSPFTSDPKYKPKIIDRFKASGNLATPLYYDAEFVDRLENEWLFIPLKSGWTENVYYVGDKIYRAKLKINAYKLDAWDKNESVPFDLIGLDYIKILFNIGTTWKQFKFEPIEI